RGAVARQALLVANGDPRFGARPDPGSLRRGDCGRGSAEAAKRCEHGDVVRLDLQLDAGGAARRAGAEGHFTAPYCVAQPKRTSTSPGFDRTAWQLEPQSRILFGSAGLSYRQPLASAQVWLFKKVCVFPSTLYWTLTSVRSNSLPVGGG